MTVRDSANEAGGSVAGGAWAAALRFPIHQHGEESQVLSPGMVPHVSLPAGVYGMPEANPSEFAPYEKPIRTPKDITRGLGLTDERESEFQTFLAHLSVDNPACLQHQLLGWMRERGMDAHLRSEILARVRSFFKETAKPRNTARIHQLRTQGARPDGKMAKADEFFIPPGLELRKGQGLSLDDMGLDGLQLTTLNLNDHQFAEEYLGKASAWAALCKHVGLSGPFIGPRGGKWADAKHTVSWSPEAAPPAQRPPPGRVTVHAQGELPPEGVKWRPGHPGPGFKATLNFKGRDYHVAFDHDAGKFKGTVTLPGGATHVVSSPNQAANAVLLHSRGMDHTLSATEVKKLGLGYTASKLFGYGKAGEKVTPAPPLKKPKAKPRKGGKSKNDDQEVAAAPAAQASKLGKVGRAAPLYMAAGSGAPVKQAAKYVLMDANDLVASHQPHNGFREHPAYPQGVQERRYDRDRAEQLKVHGVAQQLNPEILFTPSVDAIQGPPVVTDDGMVLGGNGRSMGLQLHYAADDAKAAATRAYLEEHAPVYGFTAADVKAVKNPVVVRMVETPQKDQKALATLVRRYNESSSQGMDARAAAVGEARRMDEHSMSLLGNSMPEDATLNDYLGSRASLPFVDSLRASGILNQRNASVLLSSDGLLNDDGRQMVSRVLTAALIPEANLLEDIGGQMRGTLARSAPYVLAAAAETDPEWDLRPAVQAAARDLVRARSTGATTVDEFLSQGSLFGDAKATDGVPMGGDMLRLLWDVGDKPVVFSRVMKGYLNAARRNPRGQVSMFAEEKVPPAETFKKLVREATGARKSVTDPVGVLEMREWLELAAGVLGKAESMERIYLEKGGPGSGIKGHTGDGDWRKKYPDHANTPVLGKTSSGKEIMDDARSPGHEGFTKQDHVDAQRLHADKMRSANDPGQRSWHEEQAGRHAGAAEELGARRTEFKKSMRNTSTAGTSLRKDLGTGFAGTRGGEGSKGGHVIGHTGSGKPVYASTTSMEQHAQRTKGFTPQDHQDAALSHDRAKRQATQHGTPHQVEYHRNMAESHDAASEGGHQYGGGFFNHIAQHHANVATWHARQDAARAPLAKSLCPTLTSTFQKQWQLFKAARGGKYHARIPDVNGTHRYVYDAEKYAKRPDAHLRGSEILRDRARKEILDRTSDGAGPETLDGIAARHDPGMVRDVLKELVDGGKVELRDGQYHRKDLSAATTAGAVEKGAPHRPVPPPVFRSGDASNSPPPKPAQAPASTRAVQHNIRQNAAEMKPAGASQ